MSTRLPRAPLTEVVFEMRWRIAGGQQALASDPGFGFVFDSFSKFARKRGFPEVKDLVPPFAGLPGSISRRFYRENQNFPLYQIGPGVFAANDSSDYEWPKFSRMAKDGALEVFSSYPKLTDHPFEVSHLELRYIDSFDRSLFGTSDIMKFANQATKFRLDVPPEFLRSPLSGETRGTLHVEADLTKPKGAVFGIQLSSARRDDTSLITMNSKLVHLGTPIKAKSAAAFALKLGEWLEQAHAVTSDAFKYSVSESTMEKFR